MEHLARPAAVAVTAPLDCLVASPMTIFLTVVALIVGLAAVLFGFDTVWFLDTVAQAMWGV